mmetsp:Transcript_4968/g.7533  ORF Transcript_4968/g.7533 Transcript_4968/m.7533 type:complete len:235 (+) Transcript_4968:108-812(+)
MGILTIPRTLAACCRGYYKAWRSPMSNEKLQMVGIGRNNPYCSSHFSGIFDFDIFGHMNHAVYLQYAELARWEISAMNGSLSWCIKEKTGFVVVGLAARYRKELGMFRRFEIETTFATCDEQNFWIYHTFRYPSSPTATATSPHLDGSNRNKNRILFQTLIQASLVKNGKAINPKDFLERLSTKNPNIIQELCETDDEIMLKKMSSFQQIEQVLRESANIDDDMIQQHVHTKPK